MAEGHHNRIRWNYTDRAGNVWAISADAYLVGQADVDSNPLQGGTPDTASASPARPSQWKPRRVLCYSTTSSHSRMVTLYTADAPLATPGVAININVVQSDGTENEESFKSSGRVLPEGSGKNATRQH